MVQSRNFREILQKMSKRGPFLSNQICISLILQIIRQISLKLFLDTTCSKTRVIADSQLISDHSKLFQKKVAVSVSAFESLFLLFWRKNYSLLVWICSCSEKKRYNMNNFRNILKKSPVKFVFYALVTAFSKRQFT